MCLRLLRRLVMLCPEPSDSKSLMKPSGSQSGERLGSTSGHPVPIMASAECFLGLSKHGEKRVPTTETRGGYFVALNDAEIHSVHVASQGTATVPHLPLA